MKEKLNRLLALAEIVIRSADNTGCGEDLTVVNKSSLDMLEDFIVNHCEED